MQKIITKILIIKSDLFGFKFKIKIAVLISKLKVAFFEFSLNFINFI